jgi:hypothetical protein
METWIRLVVFALILLSLLRRISKARTRTNIPRPTPNSGAANAGSANARTVNAGMPNVGGPGRITPTLVRPRQGKKNDFRDVPPPPENPELG